MKKERTQLNINIDPKLLLRLKSEAIKNGQSLTAFVTEKLENNDSMSKEDALEQRLTKLEKHLNLNQSSSNQGKDIGSIFTDEGAKEYGDEARRLFRSFLQKKGLSLSDGLKDIGEILSTLPHSYPELVFQILIGTHDLTGQEMTKAYRYGSCAMRAALVTWSGDSLEELNEAFLNAVIAKSLK